MSGALTIIEFIVAFGVLVFLHEFGHFLTARLFKVEVEEFGFGFPPRLIKLFKLGGTEFTLNWIPFGAFVRPKGENDPNIPGGLAAANPWKRLAVLFGGPLMNLITGIILFSIVFTRTGAPDSTRVEINGISQNSPAESVGLRPGDLITAINHQPIDSMARLSSIVQTNLGKEITITYMRDGKTIDVTATPRLNPPPNQGSLGITMTNPVSPINIGKALPLGALMTVEQGRELILLPGRLIRGQVPQDQARFVGPVGIFNIYQQAQQRDIESEKQIAAAEPTLPAVNRLWFLAVISVALGFTNLLPLPALDGGRILFVLPELIFRRRVPAQYENMIHMIGFIALLALMVYITTQDIVNPINLH
jgi:regulator of sigma E protease